jgi:hypothetical protein
MDRWIWVVSKGSSWVMKGKAGPIRDRSVHSGRKLDGVMGGDEEGSELSEPLKVGPAVFVKLAGQVIQVCHTIFKDTDPLGVKPLRAVEEIHDASADHGIQCHERSLKMAVHLRPPFFLVSCPEKQHSIPIHPANLRSLSPVSTLPT